MRARRDKRPLPCRHGFSLVEMVVAMVVVPLVLLVAYRMFGAASQQTLQGGLKLVETKAISDALTAIRMDLRACNGFTVFGPDGAPVRQTVNADATAFDPKMAPGEFSRLVIAQPSANVEYRVTEDTARGESGKKLFSLVREKRALKDRTDTTGTVVETRKFMNGMVRALRFNDVESQHVFDQGPFTSRHLVVTLQLDPVKGSRQETGLTWNTVLSPASIATLTWIAQ